MAIIPLFRVILFSTITLFSLVVLGICAHIEFLAAGYTSIYLAFVPLGLAASCLTVVSLPLFLILGTIRRGVFTSMILFEIIWFFLLWLLWVATAGTSVAGKSYSFPDGCIYTAYPAANQICYEFTVVEAFAFLNFFLAFIYYDVIFLYAIINAVRGRGIWTASVQEAALISSAPVNPAVPMSQPQFNAAPGAPYQNYPQYPQQQQQPYMPPPQGFPQQMPPQGTPTAPMAQQPYNYPPSPGTPQQQPQFAGYSPNAPSANSAPLPPQPNYGNYPPTGSQSQLPLPSGYQGQPQPQAPPQAPYGGAIPV